VRLRGKKKKKRARGSGSEGESEGARERARARVMGPSLAMSKREAAEMLAAEQGLTEDAMEDVEALLAADVLSGSDEEEGEGGGAGGRRRSSVGGRDEEEEESGEELFGDDWEADYVARPELDTYDTKHLDSKQYRDLTAEERREAEAVLERRERAAEAAAARDGGFGAGSRVPTTLADFAMDAEEGREFQELRMAGMDRGRGARRADSDSEEEATQLDAEVLVEDAGDFDWEQRRGPLREWVQLDQVRKAVLREFFRFLTEFVAEGGADGDRYYVRAIDYMCARNQSSLRVSWVHLAADAQELAMWVVDAPKQMLPLFDDVLQRVVVKKFRNYRNIGIDLRVRITDLPQIDTLRQLRHSHLNALLRTEGVVTRRTAVSPQLVRIVFDCGRCSAVLGPYPVTERGPPRLTVCPQCQAAGPFFTNDAETVYRNHQQLTLQETPGSVPPGRLPRSKEVILTGDLVDCARPGEKIGVTGTLIHRLDTMASGAAGWPVFATMIEANDVTKPDSDFASLDLTEADEAAIRRLGRDPRIGERIVASFAPSIYGHEDIKLAMCLSMFGGVSKDVQRRHRIRGDINVLLMGDPGCGKSQFLKYAEKLAPRAVYATGQGASAVGLTAAVRKDPLSKEWTLEGGALVLADRGVCLIDEFDKMNDSDRTSIHEAMEQQSISISKAGIVTTLHARCAVIAAANPIGGRYDSSRTFADNVDLTEPILDRFDIMVVVRDIVDPVADERLGKFVVRSHRKALHTREKTHPTYPEQLDAVLAEEEAERQAAAAAAAGGAAGGTESDAASESGARPGPISDAEAAVQSHLRQSNSGFLEQRTDANDLEPIDQSLLKKYLLYARRKVQPRLVNIDADKIAKLYADLRRASMSGGGVPMGVRYLESIIRMSEAHARMHLRDHVLESDVNVAIRVCIGSFISTQKYSVAKYMSRHFRKYISYKKDNNELLMHLLQEEVRDMLHYYSTHRGDTPNSLSIDLSTFEARARDHEIRDVSLFLKSKEFRAKGFQLRKDSIVKKFN
jgi:DNA replication licensing factor MCM2